MQNNKELIDILKIIIEKYEKRIEQLDNINNSPIFVYNRDIQNLESDINNIVNFDLKIAQEILDELQTPSIEKSTILRYLQIVQQLLRLNIEKSTSFIITEEQIGYIKTFIEKAKELKRKNEEVQNNNFKSIGTITKKYDTYKRLLSRVESKDRKIFIEDNDLINSLLEECSNEEEKKKLLIGIMKYNQEVYSNSYTCDTIPIKMERLNKDDVINLFNKFGYNFLDLKEEYQEDILNYGNIINMMELFGCLNNHKIPKFNLEKDGIKLVRILINCNKEVFDNIINYSVQKGLKASDLMNLIPALIGQTKPKNNRKNNESNNPKNKTPIISGKSKDYVENVAFLESIGFTIEYVYDKCKDILIMNHQKLIDNYNTFCEYGFTFAYSDNGGLFNKALSCLLSSNFAEIADQFIEICPEGHRYIKANMSRLNVISSPHHIALYNIYASYMDHDVDGFYQNPEGPFVNENSEYLRLRGEITRLSGSGYDNIPYRGIEEENKREKTNTIEIVVENKDKFDEAIKDSNYSNDRINDMTDNDEALESIEKYTDSEDNIRYNFDGILISKLKVKRIYNILKNYQLNELEDALLYAITYNSIMNEETFNKLKAIVKGRRI